MLLDPEYPVPVAGALEVLPEAPLVRAGDEADAARRAGGDLRGLQELILLARNSIKGTYRVSHNIGSTLFVGIFSGSGAHTEELLTIFQQPEKLAI